MSAIGPVCRPYIQARQRFASIGRNLLIIVGQCMLCVGAVVDESLVCVVGANQYVLDSTGMSDGVISARRPPSFTMD